MSCYRVSSLVGVQKTAIQTRLLFGRDKNPRNHLKAQQIT